jgi:hypothetical protein
LQPATARAGNRAGRAELQIAASATDAVGDAIARFFVGYSGTGSGLRGGSFSYALNDIGYDYTFDGVQWTEDVSVSGAVLWNQATGDISARLRVRQSGHAVGTLEVTWNDTPANAVANISGRINGREVRASRVAP